MPRDCLRIIESKSKVRNSRNKPVVAKVSSSTSTPGISPDVAELKDMVKALLLDKKSQAPTTTDPVITTSLKPPQLTTTKEIPVIEPRLLIKFDLPVFLPFKTIKEIIKTVTTKEIISTKIGETIDNQRQIYQPLVNQPPVHQASPYQAPAPQTQGSGTLPSNTVTNPKEDLKGITTRSGVAYKGPTIPTTSSPKVVERETEVTKDTMPPTNNKGTKEVKPQVSKSKIMKPISEAPLIAPTGHALIDVYEGELTLRVGNKAITFNLDQTSRYSANYNEMSANQIDVIEMACEEYSQEVLEDDPTSPEVDPTYYDTDGDILLLEAILNSDPNQGSYLPEIQKDLKICEANNEKSSVKDSRG
ncbi:hypothetical protein Tco_0782134 [Tanacetum coccineum]